MPVHDGPLRSIVVECRADGDGSAGPAHARLLHAAFFESLRANCPNLAEAVHRADPKPFTLAFLDPQGRWSASWRCRSGETVAFRVASVAGPLSDVLDEAFRPGTVLHLDSLPVVVSRLLGEGEHPTAGRSSFEELYLRWLGDVEPGDAALVLRFLTPTAFKNPRGGFDPYPSPSRVFSSLAARWATYSTVDLDVDVGLWSEASIESPLFAGRTPVVPLGPANAVPGFLGWARYRVRDHRDRTSVGLLNLLADFAFYAGIGAKTAFGLGQVVREASPRLRP